MAHIFRSSLTVGLFFGLNKLLALIRQYAIASRFGFSSEIDAFNVANNLPDLVFSLFSGGALAMAFIPVFAQYLDVHGKDLSWKLFSKVTTLICAFTAIASLLIAVFAPALVSSPLGVAPGFDPAGQALVVDLLRINLVATMVFALSGLVTASLQAHNHFLLPAAAPLLYNLGIIIGATVLAPLWGIYGLTWGVVLGALLHLFIQVPALRRFRFRFSFSWRMTDPGIKKIFRLMWPRVLTVLLINITFLLRDNFASRMETGAVTALTYGYFIMQVPETLIGTSLATALLPTLSLHASRKKRQEFARVLSASVRILIAASVLPAVLSFAALTPLINLVFDFSAAETQLLAAVTNAFMAGLLAQTVLEILVRAYYAKQQPMVPLTTTLLRTIVFAVLGIAFYRQTGGVGLAAIDSLSVALQAAVLFILVFPTLKEKTALAETSLRSILAGAAAFLLAVVLRVSLPLSLLAATGAYIISVRRELKLFLKL